MAPVVIKIGRSLMAAASSMACRRLTQHEEDHDER